MSGVQNVIRQSREYMFIKGKDLWMINEVISLKVKLTQGAIVYDKNK